MFIICLQVLLFPIEKNVQKEGGISSVQGNLELLLDVSVLVFSTWGEN
jgi:hypothetical protein